MTPVPENDPLLAAFLAARDESSAARLLGALLEEVAVPHIRRVVARKIGVSDTARHGNGLLDVDDIAAEIRVGLLCRLQALRAGQGRPIADFRAYCASCAQSGWVDRLRLLRPERARLLHQVRYLLAGERRNRGFALWPAADGGTEWCGFTAWRDARTTPAAPGRLRALAEDPLAFLQGFLLGPEEATQVSPARLLAAVFDRLGGPAPLEDVADAIGALWDAGDAAARGQPAPGLDALPDPLPAPDDAAGWLDYLRWLWEAVQTLPRSQRLAFVLHSDVTTEWAELAVTDRAGLAGALEISPRELDALWPDIPLPDAATAERLGISRQQVINLRKAARIHLGRKFKEILSDPGFFPPSQGGALSHEP